MDAQNAAGSEKTKPAASESKRPGHEPDESSTVTMPTKPALGPIPSASAKESKSSAADDDSTVTVAAGDGANSDAETIVLPGKDGHSPSKARKVKHEQKSDEEGIAGSRKHKEPASGGHRDADGDKQSGVGAGGLTDGAPSQALKKKRAHDKVTDKHPHPGLGHTPRSKDGTSSISSAPTSPRPKYRRPAGDASDSESDAPRHKSPKIAKDRVRTVDKAVVGHKRKAPKTESEDEAESRRARRQRTSTSRADLHPAKASKEQKPTKPNDHADRHRSTSPHPQRHRRSISTQLPLSNGLSQKKKRIPAPLQNTDYHSDESSASGSPHPRSSRLHGLTTPATADSAASPAKMAPHKKHLDAHGQTLLARACARGEYEIAKQRLQERPEDLNVADYAGNTPLQIAAINGCEDIVQLLIEAGCNLECVNYDKDTPLLDAVDNGHLGVIKLLLSAGVNPRKANVNGEEPIDRIRDDLDNAVEIRAALQEARQRMGERRPTSEEHHPHERPDTRDSHGPDSPRRSPQAASHAANTNRHPRTVRATKTSNHLLYMPMDDKTLRQAAGKGDQETVMRILQVRDGCDDAESMVSAARGGHEVVLQLLLALGGANPDPPPLEGVAKEVATPMLAAIGQENIKVIELLLEQGDFDPTRKFRGETYYEIARRRQGTHWKEEEHILKNAYDSYKKKSQKDGTKTKSPNRRERDRERERERDQDREAKRASRNEAKEESARAHKRNLSSPSREPETRKKTAKSAVSPKEKRRSDSFSHQEERTSPKRGPGRPRKEVPAINVSDRESSPALHRANKVKRAESDVAGASSEGETLKPRRKLVSKGELNKGEREREKQRRVSQVPGSMKDPSSPRPDDHGEKPKADKHLERTKALKRDESRDRLSVSGESTTKRHHSSSTPPPSSTGDKDDSEAPPKRRRLDVEGKERRQKHASSTEDRPAKSGLSREASVKSAKSIKTSKSRGGGGGGGDDDDRREGRTKKSDPHRRESAKSTSSEKSIHVKCEDIEMDDAPYTSPTEEANLRAKQEAEEAAAKEAAAKEAAAKEREEQKRREAEEKEKEEREREKEKERKKQEELEAKRKEEERRRKEEERKRKAEEEERKRQEEEERKRKEDEERKRKEEEEERKRREEAEKKRREEEERRQVEEEERKRKEEEERKRKEEEERLRREQLEREAAEAARRKREEEERKERELRERQRAAREAELRRIREEQERIRLDKLPGLFRWLDQCPNPKTPELGQKFSKLLGFRFETLRPEASGTPEAKELWTLNLSVALLLGIKDLSLSAYTAWERTPATPLAKKVIWGVLGSQYSLQDWPELGQQLPNYYGADVTKPDGEALTRVRNESRERFMKMDLFFVKVSDVMYIVPNNAHLRGLQITVTYKELPESESEWLRFKPAYKWKQDGEYAKYLGTGFGPRDKYYVNGIHVGDEEIELTPVSKTPFPEPKYPRRNGLYRVFPGEADYEKLCRAQGLDHLLKTPSQSPSLPNGFHSPLMSHAQTPLHSALAQKVNGTSHPPPAPNPNLNLNPNASEDAKPTPPPPNGVNGNVSNEENVG